MYISILVTPFKGSVNDNIMYTYSMLYTLFYRHVIISYTTYQQNITRQINSTKVIAPYMHAYIHLAVDNVTYPQCVYL